MDQSRVLRFLGQVGTCRVVLFMSLFIASALSLWYFELTPIYILSPRSSTVSEFSNSNGATKSAENTTFLASQEVSPRISTHVSNYSTKSEAPGPGQRRDNGTTSPKYKKSSLKPPLVVISITEMNNMISKRHSDPNNSLAPRWGSEADKELKTVREMIKNADLVEKDDTLYAPLYHNLTTFKRSYELMEQILKVYVYSEGDRPIFHEPDTVIEGIYASEGWFMKQMENSSRYLTKDPTKAHLFYLAFSSRILQQQLYVRDSHRRANLIEYLLKYHDLISSNYTFWNRTRGSDHFLAACHDWAPAETRGPYLNCIRSLCNANVGSDFVVGKDVSLPTTRVFSTHNPYGNIGGNLPSNRTILAFFAGNLHGYVRPILLNQWSSSPESDMKILNHITHKSYIEFMKSSKFCICAKGFDVHSPRVVEAILYGCVPVIISDNYVPPFLEVLDWESFSVFVPEKDIPNLRRILISISESKYEEMQRRVLQVQKHFMWHDGEPVRYDLFHMILHSVWYNRVFQTFESD